MHNLIEYVKKHPMIATIVGMVGIAILYLITRSRQTTTSSNGASSLADLSLQEQQLAAAQNTQNAQLSAQSQAQQLSANVAQNQTNAALSAANENTDAQLIAALAANNTTAQSNELSAEVTNNTNSLEAGVMNNQTNAELAALENTTQAQVSVNTLQAGLYNNYINSQTQLAGESMNDSLAQNQSILQIVSAAGLDHGQDTQGTQTLENDLAGIIGEVEGQQGSASSAFGAASASAITGSAADIASGGILNQIASFGKTLVSAL